jgi:hypothetical protein
MKICNKCKVSKHKEEDFALISIATGKRRSTCRDCHSQYRKEHYLKNHDKYKNIARDYAENNKGSSVNGKLPDSKPGDESSTPSEPAKFKYQDNIKKQLEMSFGKASYILKRMIMFALICELKKDVCYRCDKKIVSDCDLSVDHKNPWLHIDSKLFWNLDNIAFSHKLCNSANHRIASTTGRRSKLRKLGPEGMAWCSGHKDFIRIDKFTSNTSNWNRVEHYCKECRRKLRNKKYEEL